MTKALLAVAALLTLLAAPVAAHVTVTVDPLTAPLQVGVPTNVTVHFSEPCFEVLPQEAQGVDSVASGLAPAAPASVAWAGETVPFTTDLCDPTAVPFALVRATALLTLTATADAPGLVAFDLPVTSYLGGGTEPGETVPLNVTVAYHANGTLSAAKATGHDAHGGNGTAIELALDYATNADSLLTIEATTSSGEVLPIDTVPAAPPSFNNKTRGTANATAHFVPPAEWSTADLTFKAYLTPKAGGAKVPVGVATLTLANDAAADTHGDGEGHDHDDEAKDSPAPVFAFVAVGLLALVALRRR